MGLRIVYGRAGSGKTRFCLNEIKERIDKKCEHQLILLVPEQYSFQAERDLISVLKNGGIIKTEVLSFQRMAYRIFNEAGGITYPHMHPAGKAMILYRILDRLQGNFRVFANSADREGFVNEIGVLISEFKRYGVVPQHLADASQNFEDNSILKHKLSELYLIYEEFEKALAQRYRDADDDLTLASRKLSECTLFDGAEIWIDGFATFTPQEYKLIEALLKKAGRITISLCLDSLNENPSSYGIDVFQGPRKAFQKLMKICQSNNIEIEPSVFLDEEPLPRFKDSPELAHLEKYYSAMPYKSWMAKTCDISLFSSLNIFSEVEETARDIISLVRDNNMRFKDIAVVTGNLSAYEKIIDVVFTEYGIPFFIDKKVDLDNHPLIRLILSMMDIFSENWSYEAVFRYLKTGLTGIDKDEIDRLENYVLACGIRGNMWTDNEKWLLMPELLTDEVLREPQLKMLEDINNIRSRVVSPLLEFRAKTKGRRTAAEFCSNLYDFLVLLGVPQRIEEIVEAFKSKGDLALANEYSQVWNTVMNLFDQVVEVMGDETFGIERFSKILRMGLGEYKIGIVPQSLDQVLVGNIERSKSHEIKALYIIGANDGVFPSPLAKEGLLSDEDRIALDHIGIELAKDTKTQAFDEQYLIYRTLTVSGRYLKISWPIADNEGRSMRPSMVISRLRKLFPEISEKSNIVPLNTQAEALGYVAEKIPTFRHMVAALRKKADGEDINPVWEDVYRWYISSEQWKDSCGKLKKAFKYRNLAQPINENTIRELYGDPAISSISRIEKFTACPFSFYVQYGLGAKERKIYRLSPPDIGTFMHAVIERFSQIVSEGEMTWRSFDKEWCRKKVSEIVDEMLIRMQGSGVAASKRYRSLIVRLKRVVARAVWLIAQHIRAGSFEPIEYEVNFGENEKYPPITIELESGMKIHLTGRIDRIDAFKTEEGTYLRIIDYKSGAKDFKLSDVYYGLQIQLITYMDAIWESGEKEGQQVYPGGMLYFKIDDPIIRSGGKLDEEEIEKAILRQLRMKGLLLADVKVVKAMDKFIEGPSQIIPATLNKGDVLGKNTSGATLEQFKLLRKFARRLLKDICTEIMSGNVEIKPYKKKGLTACSYCSFLPVCQFDPSFKENSYRMLFDKNNDEIWEQMSGRG